MPEITEIKQELDELKKLILKQNKPEEDSFEKSGKVFKWLQSIIALLLVIGGLGINWGIISSELAVAKTQIQEIKESTGKEQDLYRHEIDKLKEIIVELKLRDATQEQNLNQIQSDITEIKQDVKKLIRSR